MASILLSKKPDAIHDSSRKIDHLAERTGATVRHSILEQVELQASVGSVGFGNTNVHFRIPREGYMEKFTSRLTMRRVRQTFCRIPVFT